MLAQRPGTTGRIIPLKHFNEALLCFAEDGLFVCASWTNTQKKMQDTFNADITKSTNKQEKDGAIIKIMDVWATIIIKDEYYNILLVQQEKRRANDYPLHPYRRLIRLHLSKL